jgi:hypothetical protein
MARLKWTEIKLSLKIIQPQTQGIPTSCHNVIAWLIFMNRANKETVNARKLNTLGKFNFKET